MGMLWLLCLICVFNVWHWKMETNINGWSNINVKWIVQSLCWWLLKSATLASIKFHFCFVFCFLFWLPSPPPLLSCLSVRVIERSCFQASDLSCFDSLESVPLLKKRINSGQFRSKSNKPLSAIPIQSLIFFLFTTVILLDTISARVWQSLIHFFFIIFIWFNDNEASLFDYLFRLLTKWRPDYVFSYF